MRYYTVQQGDTLAKIADAFDLASWKRIYDRPDNAEFRSKRPNPNLIFPGDLVFVSGREDRKAPASTDTLHIYVYHNTTLRERGAV